MKKFISQSVVFALITATLIVSFIGGLYSIQSKASFKLSEGKHILILGDSHTRFAIDDNIFSRAENVSIGAEAYLYSYCKLKKFLEENEQMDTVILSFWGRNVRAGIDQWLFSESNMAERIPRYLPFMEKEEMAVFSEEKVAFVHAALHPEYMFLINMLRGKPLSCKALNIGAYRELHRDKLQEDIERRRGGNEPEAGSREEDGDSINLAVYQKAYLLKIVELCKSRDVELILLNTPTYKPEKYGDNEFANDFHGAYMPDVKYMDYSAYPLPDSCYGDISHLNYRGARIFSQHLRERFSADMKEIGAKNRWVYGETAE
ncbi:MAG: hypothetical protein LBH72_05265 [Proteiniphilum sp.]|jgi:hypothetical protein|nr:hypothetical protein [Proteiniphilum sp.]